MHGLGPKVQGGTGQGGTGHGGTGLGGTPVTLFLVLVLLGTVVPLGVLVALGAAPAAAVVAGTYRNPLSRLDTPDSDVVRLGDRYYAFSTGDGYDNIPVMSTTDLSSWPQTLMLNPSVSDALPCRAGTVAAGTCQLSNWGTRAPHNGAPWSPSMIEVGGEYYLFYAAWDPSVAHYCVGVAESSDPIGPYVDRSAATCRLPAVVGRFDRSRRLPGPGGELLPGLEEQRRVPLDRRRPPCGPRPSTSTDRGPS